MVDTGRSARFALVAEFARRRMLRVGAASVVATAIVAAAPVADARTTKIQIMSRTTAFGGYSFPGVGQYEVITGVATGEVNPKDPKNAVITDIALAPRLPNGNVQYQHNFYILKPVDLGKGNHKMMYEPPNRGRKTYQELNRTPDGGNDPAAALTEAAFPGELANSFLWSRGYTTVWSGWENNLGPLTGNRDGGVAGGDQRRRLDDYRTRIRVHRQPGCYLYTGVSRCFKQPRSVECKADASHSLGRHPGGRPAQRLGLYQGIEHSSTKHGNQADGGEFCCQ